MITVLSPSALSLLWPAVAHAQACVGNVSSIADVAAAVKCQTVNINAFTVPPNVTLNLSLLDNATVNMLGNVTFGVFNWAGTYQKSISLNVTNLRAANRAAFPSQVRT